MFLLKFNNSFIILPIFMKKKKLGENQRTQSILKKGGLYRSSLLKVLCKTPVLRNFAKFTGKHLCENYVLFINIANTPKKTLSHLHRKETSVFAGYNQRQDLFDGYICRATLLNSYNSRLRLLGSHTCRVRILDSYHCQVRLFDSYNCQVRLLSTVM